MILRGTGARVVQEAHRRIAELPDDAVLWIGEAADAGRFETLAPAKVGRALGRAFDVVVLDARAGFHAEALGQAHGLVWGGGELVVLRGEIGAALDASAREPLAAWPFAPADVTTHFDARVDRSLSAIATLADEAPARVRTEIRGTEEQARAVETIASALLERSPARIALLADRGRGKSSALGLAIRRVLDERACEIAVTGPSLEAAAEVFRFAAREGAPCPRFVDLRELLRGGDRFDAIAVDEAAQLPVPLLRRLVARHDASHIAFATTTHGYEGTGRGFSLRFLRWLRARDRPVIDVALAQPIRWDAGDPLERGVFSALLLDAEIAEIADVDEAALDVARLEHRILSGEDLAADERRLAEIFGLLVHAHHRTTPGDLHRMLDAPNLAVHVLLHDDRVVAGTLVAREGALPEAMSDAVVRGRVRLRAHALADTLLAHLGHVEAGALSMIRSVRIAVHPALRRRGLASTLVEHVHRAYAPDFFGTIFGATPELVQFRRSVGYELVRVSASRGARTGEPAATMLHPRTDRARALLSALRAELARELPLQLRLLSTDDELPLDADLESALRKDLPAPAPIDDAELPAHVHAYAFGPRTFESAAVAIVRWVERNPTALERLSPIERAVVQGRVLRGDGWLKVTRDAGVADVAIAMRTLRRAIRAMLERS